MTTVVVKQKGQILYGFWSSPSGNQLCLAIQLILWSVRGWVQSGNCARVSALPVLELLKPHPMLFDMEKNHFDQVLCHIRHCCIQLATRHQRNAVWYQHDVCQSYLICAYYLFFSWPALLTVQVSWRINYFHKYSNAGKGVLLVKLELRSFDVSLHCTLHAEVSVMKWNEMMAI